MDVSELCEQQQQQEERDHLEPVQPAVVARQVQMYKSTRVVEYTPKAHLRDTNEGRAGFGLKN